MRSLVTWMLLESHISGVSRCSLHQTCHDCQADVACGWCDDGSGSGIGVCMEGGQRGPVNPVTRATHRDKCHAHNWYFTECPRKFTSLVWFRFNVDVKPFVWESSLESMSLFLSCFNGSFI